MRLNQFSNWVPAGLILSVAAALGCNQSNQTASAANPDSGKISITTSSDEAKKEFVQGRDMFERLQANDSIQHFDKALALDPTFASAELALANGTVVIEVNPERTPLSDAATVSLRETAAGALPGLLQRLPALLG